MRFIVLFIVLLSLVPANAYAEKVHVVASGHTLGGIAKRYRVSIAAICTANDISRRDPIRAGQKLVIPDKDDKDGKKARSHRISKESPSPERTPNQAPPPRSDDGDGMQVLDVPGFGKAYYYSPTGPGRLSLRPVLMYLHGRAGQPQRDCRRWATFARRLGWVVCPEGPGAWGEGRGWNNNWVIAHRTVMATLGALRTKYGRRVQLYGNTLIGFSEGAFVAMNIGVREPRAFNRWLILAASDSYWGPLGQGALVQARHRLRKVYLITGEKDSVVEETKDVREILRKVGVATRITTPDQMGHELWLERRRDLYFAALDWLGKS